MYKLKVTIQVKIRNVGMINSISELAGSWSPFFPLAISTIAFVNSEAIFLVCSTGDS